MTEKEMMSNTTRGIIALFVIVLVGIFIFPSFNKIYASLKGDFDGLKDSQKQLILGNFDNLASVAQECRQINDERCICKDAFKTFPNTFPKEFSIKIIQGINATLIPQYNENDIKEKNKTIENAGFFKVEKPFSGSDIKEENRQYIKYILLDFKDKPLMLFGADEKGAKSDARIISGDLYKGASSNIFYFLTLAGPVAGNEDFQKKFFLIMPKCMDNRKEAISKFNAFILDLKTKNEIKIDLPDDYRIFYGGRIIKLDYKGSDVEIEKPEYNIMELSADIVRNESLSNVKCESPAIADYLEDGDKISITRTGSDFCIKKI